MTETEFEESVKIANELRKDLTEIMAVYLKINKNKNIVKVAFSMALGNFVVSTIFSLGTVLVYDGKEEDFISTFFDKHKEEALDLFRDKEKVFEEYFNDVGKT